MKVRTRRYIALMLAVTTAMSTISSSGFSVYAEESTEVVTESVTEESKSSEVVVTTETEKQAETSAVSETVAEDVSETVVVVNSISSLV
jgi:hypothetical protein